MSLLVTPGRGTVCVVMDAQTAREVGAVLRLLTKRRRLGTMIWRAANDSVTRKPRVGRGGDLVRVRPRGIGSRGNSRRGKR